MFCAATIQPVMADLPIERLIYQSLPFTNTAVDNFGPFYYTVRRTLEKMWGFLLNCLLPRAVHLKFVLSKAAYPCVMGIEPFACHRGTLSMIWSDNNSNFFVLRNSSATVLRNGTQSTSPQNLPTKTLSAISRHQKRHTKVASGRG